MRDIFLYVIAAFILIALQAVLFKGIKPDLVLVLVCLFSLRYGPVKGMAFGAAAGLLLDAASGFIMGPNIISKSAVAVLMNLFRNKFYNWNSLLSAFVIMGMMILDVVLVYFYMRTFSSISPAELHLKPVILQGIYTSAASLLFYHIIRPERQHVREGIVD
jgi:rod shape-determining protein MreD